MPNETNLDKLHLFEAGGILSQQSIKECVNGQIMHYSIVNTVRDEVVDMLINELKIKPDINCLFDDILISPFPKKRSDLFDPYGIYYQNEVYYYVQNKDTSFDLLKKCFHYSTNGWHSLCVLTKANFDKNIKKISLDKFYEIARKTCLIILQAYDGEGYVFWEGENVNFFD